MIDVRVLNGSTVDGFRSSTIRRRCTNILVMLCLNRVYVIP